MTNGFCRTSKSRFFCMFCSQSQYPKPLSGKRIAQNNHGESNHHTQQTVGKGLSYATIYPETIAFVGKSGKGGESAAQADYSKKAQAFTPHSSPRQKSAQDADGQAAQGIDHQSTPGEG